MSSNPNRPPLPADTLWQERAELVGTFLGSITFGAAFIIYLLTLGAIFRKTGKTFKDWALLAFTTALFLLGLVYMALDIRTQIVDFIEDRQFPGGPEAYEGTHYSDALWVIPNVAYVVAEWLADAFLLYRCVMIFRLHLAFVTLPILIYLGSIAMGILLLFQTSRPGATLWTKVSVDFGLPYFALSAALNVLVTILIAARLLLFRRSMVKALGQEHALSLPYASIAAILIESSMMYAVSSLLFIGTYGAKSHASLLFLPILSGVQIIAPTLIVYRVATMRAWDSTTSKTHLTTLQFGTRRDGTSEEDSAETTNYLGSNAAHEVPVHLSRSVSRSVGGKP